MLFNIILSTLALLPKSSSSIIHTTDEVFLTPTTSLTGERKETYEQFLGIPFAQPPIGDLRFRNPKPLPLWSGNRMATAQVDPCWQFDPQLDIPLSGSEDCLYLNVYRPTKRPKTDELLHVVVFLHGGSFHSGTTSPSLYGPEFFMETGEVLLVVPAYRLNVFGFLSAGDKTLSGNYGLKDQSMALRWVRDHVAAFGGNPHSVTLMGHEAGGVSVNYHLLSSHSQGLFHRAAMFSGMADMPWTRPMENARQLANRHAAALGLQNADQMSSQTLAEFFRSIPARNLTEALKQLKAWDNLPVTSYLPCVEVEWLRDPFLTVDPAVALKEGNFVNVPILSTIVPGDGIRFVHPLIRADARHEEFNRDVHRLLPLVLGIGGGEAANVEQIVDEIRFHYLGPSGLLAPETVRSVLEMSSDYFVKWPYYRKMQLLAQSSEAPVFGHLFDYRGLNSFSSVFLDSSEDLGVVHGDDLMYLFRMGDAFPVQLGPTDILAKNFYMKYVLKFIKTGEPGWERWRVRSPEMATTVNFNETSSMIGLHMIPADRLEFWDSIDERLKLVGGNETKRSI